MPEIYLFVIGLLVTSVVVFAVLMIGAQEALDRQTRGLRVTARLDRWAMKVASIFNSRT